MDPQDSYPLEYPRQRRILVRRNGERPLPETYDGDVGGMCPPVRRGRGRGYRGVILGGRCRGETRGLFGGGCEIREECRGAILDPRNVLRGRGVG